MNNRVVALLCWLTCAVSLAACPAGVEEVPATTQVTLRIAAEPALTARIDKVRFALWTREASEWRAGTATEVAVNPSGWPLTVPVLPKNGSDSSATFEVLIEALDGGVSLLQTRVVASFVAHQLVTVSTTLAMCPTPDLHCEDSACHGAECTHCAASGVCAPVGVTTPSSQIDLTTPDAGSGRATSNGGPALGDAGSAVELGNTKDAGGTSNGAPHDGGGGAATTNDVGTTAADAGSPKDSTPAAACPAQNVCNALLYPCLPTPAGYTCQGQFADWHMPDGVTGAKFAQSYRATGETVVDNVTKLEWQAGLPNTYPGCTGRQQLSGGALGMYGEWCSREEAKTYCAQLVRGSHDDWRLPSLIELISLLDLRKDPATANAVEVNFFGDSTSQDFIASSTAAAGPGLSWMVSYELREVVLLRNLNARVRCVRGGAVPDFATPADRYLTTSDTVTDRATSLVWQRGFSPTALAGEGAAETYCAGLGQGYRVPTGNELLTLVDPTSAKVIDPIAFPGTPTGAFATSNQLVRESTVTFDTGMLQQRSASEVYVRCVRN